MNLEWTTNKPTVPQQYKEKLLAICRGLEIKTTDQEIDALTVSDLEAIGKVFAEKSKRSVILLDCIKELKGLNR